MTCINLSRRLWSIQNYLKKIVSKGNYLVRIFVNFSIQIFLKKIVSKGNYLVRIFVNFSINIHN